MLLLPFQDFCVNDESFERGQGVGMRERRMSLTNGSNQYYCLKRGDY